MQLTKQIPDDPPRMGAKSTITSNHPSTPILLCKKPEEAAKLKNWRPISLLCNDIKLVTKIVSIRLGGGL